MNDLFQSAESRKSPQNAAKAPLAERIRPHHLQEFVGQKHLVGEGRPFLGEILKDRLASTIFWGPPGCGKTTLARLIADLTKNHFVSFSAVLGGVPEIRKIVEEAKLRLQLKGQRTLLFVDEVHRFNKAQQDAFLPHVENGTLTLIGATTENPSFELNRALLSRCRVVTLNPLSKEELLELAGSAWNRIFPNQPPTQNNAKILQALVNHAQGDARRLINALESLSVNFPAGDLPPEKITEFLEEKLITYDRSGEEHYNVISAFIKSMRGTDPDATLHYLARMLEAGEDPRFIARRMIIFASEDVSNADPQALPLAIAAAEAFERVGMPEGFIPLAQAATYLACAPKSNASYVGFLEAREDVTAGRTPPVPKHLRNAPTKLMKELGYGENYRYPHNDPGHANSQSHLPEGLESRQYYRPTTQGMESKILEVLQHVRQLRKSPPTTR